MGDNDLELDVQDFCFKQMCKLKAFNPPTDLITDVVNFIIISNKFGKVYVSAGTEIKSIDITVIEALAGRADADISQTVSNFDHKALDTRTTIKHIGLTCDDLTISVVYEEDSSLCIGCFDVRCFEKPNLKGLFFATGTLSSEADVYVRELEWNPEDPDLAIVCLSNGIVSLVKISQDSVNLVASLPTTSKFYSVNWSPRGKNFASGRDDGKIMLYDKKLTLKKELPCPDDLTGARHRVVKVRWIMSHNFAAVYLNTEEDAPPKFVCIVNQKDGPTSYMNMEDVYFGFNEERKLCFYIETIPAWNILTTMASNAFEAVVIGKVQNKWVRWALNDDSRAEMPLSDDSDETFPCGIAINRNSTLNIREGETTLPPMPIFLMISTHGVLCAFQMVNKMQDVNHDILVKQAAMNFDGMRVPFVSQKKELGGQQAEATSSSSAGLPKPFISSASESSSRFASAGAQSTLFGSLPKDAATAGSKENATISSSTASVKPFDLGSKASLFSSPSGSLNPRLGFSSTYSTSPQPTKFQEAQSASSTAKDGIAIGGKENASISGPNTSVKSFNIGSKTSLFSSPSGSVNSFLGSSTSVPTFSQPTAPQESQKASMTAPSVMPQRPASLLQAGATSAVQWQQKPLPKSNSLLTGSSSELSSNVNVTTANGNSMKIVPPGKVPEEKNTTEAQLNVQAGRVPPESRLLQTLGTSKPVDKAQKSVTFVQEPPEQQPKPQQTEDATRQPVVKKLSKVESMSKDLDSEIAKSTKKEMSSFAKELLTFKSEVAEFQNAVSSIGGEEEKTALQVMSNQCRRRMEEIQACQKEHRSECAQLKRKMMRSFDNFEQARIQHAGAHDPLFRNLLKVRSLDPVASRQQKELRSQINYISALISDVSESLDIAMDRAKGTASRKIKSNNIHNIYITMESIDKIVDNLTSKVESISLKAEDDNLLPHHFTFRKSFLRESKLMENRDRLSSSSSFGTIANGRLRLSPMKMSQLDSIIKMRETASTVKSSYRDDSLVVTPRAASTPAVTQPSRIKFGNLSDAASAKLKLETLGESGLERGNQLFKEKQQGLEERKQQIGLKPANVPPKTEPSVAFGTKSGQLEEKPKAQSGFVFQPSAASVQKSALPFSFGSSTSFKVADKGFSQFNSPKVTSSQVSSNASELKKEDEAPFREILKSESNTSKPPVPSSQPANFASTYTSSLFPISNKNLLPEEKRMEPKVPGSSSSLEYKQSPFAKQLSATSVFGSSTASSTDSQFPSSVASLSTSSNVFSGSSVFVKPKLPTADCQNLTTSSTSIGFQSATSALTINETRTEQQLKTSAESVVAPNPASTNAPFLLSKPVANTVSIAASATSLSAPIVAGQLPSLESGSSQEKDTPEISTMTIQKTTSSILFGTPKVLASETPVGTPSSTPVTSSLLGRQSLSSISNTTASLIPKAKQGLFGQAGTTSALFGEKTVLSTASIPPMSQTITSSTSLRSDTMVASEISSSLTSIVTTTVSTVLATSTLSTSSLFGQQSTSLVATIPPFGNKVSESSVSSFGSSVVLPSSSSSTNKPVISNATNDSLLPTKTSTTTSSLLDSKANLAMTSAATSSFGQPSLFGTVTAQGSNGTFSASTASTKSSLFGASSSSVETKVIFGSKTDSTSGLFGQSPTQKTSLFGASTQATTSSSGAFGTASNSAPLLFGAQTTAKSSGIFGQTTSSSAPAFGNQQPSTVFVTQPSEQKNVGLFRTPAISQSSGGLFAAKTSVSSGSIFGNVSTNQVSFGQGSPSSGPQQAASSSSGMGFGGFGLGGKPTNDPSKNPFGSVPSSSSFSGGSTGLFGSPSSSSSSGGLFSLSQATSQTTKGAFSKGFGTGFMGNSPSTQSTFGSSSTGSASFGGGATFGGAPAFGSTPSFGGSPSFGSTSGFGGSASSGSTFGAGSSTFGQPTGFSALAQQASPSFGDLSTQAAGPAFGGLNANQNQMGFGNLSQQSSAFGQTGPAFGQSTSPKGSSFSSWR